jgi:exosortase family protein XrtF
LKEYFVKYRPFLRFLGIFLLTYLVLVGFYQLYLSQFDLSNFEVDGITKFVAQQTKIVMNALGYNVKLTPHAYDPSVKVDIDSVSIVRIVEGCNAVSVMILFVAFVLAFSSEFFKTAGFIAAGLLIIHVLNILRIALLTIGIMNYPEYTHILHGVIFPLVIYGIVFLLWIIWITKFASNATESAKI